MIKAQPVNGVGVRAFAFAHPEFAKAGDVFMRPDQVDEETGQQTGASYAHRGYWRSPRKPA